MRMHGRILGVLVLGGVACTATEPPSEPPPSASPEPPPSAAPEPPLMAEPAPDVVPDAVALPPDLRITLERGACYGTCPVYTIVLDARGEVEWEGRRHVEHEGAGHARVSDLEDLRVLWERLEAVDFDALPSSKDFDSETCPCAFSDHPSVTVTIVARGVTHTVFDYLGCEGYAPIEAFRELEEAIDAVAGSDAFIE